VTASNVTVASDPLRVEMYDIHRPIESDEASRLMRHVASRWDIVSLMRVISI